MSQRHSSQWYVLRRAIRIVGEDVFHEVVTPWLNVPAEHRELLSRLRMGALPAEEYESRIPESRSENRDPREEPFSDPTNIVGRVTLDLALEYDAIVVEQGYGGVYVHTYELVKHLRATGRKILLISPEAPMFERERHPDDVHMDRIQASMKGGQYVAYCNVLRGLVRAYAGVPLFIAHRSQTLLLFDLMEDRRTIVYCDGFVDGAFWIAREGVALHPPTDTEILDEIHFLLAGGDHVFKSMYGSPMGNRKLLAAGYRALGAAAENWFWGKTQLNNFLGDLPEFQDRARLALPFLRDSLFDSEKESRSKRLLYTTTMHNIDKKGFSELVSALGRIPEVEVDCIVRQPEFLPEAPTDVAARLSIRSLTKPQMVELYHRVWCNVRVSREESSPLSILETMLCRVPQIVSPAVAEQIPLIEHGRTEFVVDPDDLDSLVRHLKRLLEDEGLREAMGDECRRRAFELTHSQRANELDRIFGGQLVG